MKYKVYYVKDRKKQIKTFEIKGKIISKEVGSFLTQSGTRKSGVKIIYERKLKKGIGKGGRIKKIRRKKIIPLPRTATHIKVKSR